MESISTSVRQVSWSISHFWCLLLVLLVLVIFMSRVKSFQVNWNALINKCVKTDSEILRLLYCWPMWATQQRYSLLCLFVYSQRSKFTTRQRNIGLVVVSSVKVGVLSKHQLTIGYHIRFQVWKKEVRPVSSKKCFRNTK